MKLTPHILRHAYHYLCETPPFDDWNLPDSEDVIFEVYNPRVNDHGRCYAPVDPKDKFKIGISQRHHEFTFSLMQTMAHEMVHLHMFLAKFKNPQGHGKAFKALAAEVCQAHGFDPGQF